MKYTIKHVSQGEEEVILKYCSITPEVERILKILNGEQERLTSWKEKTLVILELSKILYIESVDSKTFAYTEEDVFRLDETLNRLEQTLNANFFRCSKSMILNIDKVESLRSLPSNRIDAVMCNGEHIMISRTYASDFRKRLKGGRENEQA